MYLRRYHYGMDPHVIKALLAAHPTGKVRRKARHFRLEAEQADELAAASETSGLTQTDYITAGLRLVLPARKT